MGTLSHHFRECFFSALVDESHIHEIDRALAVTMLNASVLPGGREFFHDLSGQPSLQDPCFLILGAADRDPKHCVLCVEFHEVRSIGCGAHFSTTELLGWFVSRPILPVLGICSPDAKVHLPAQTTEVIEEPRDRHRRELEGLRRCQVVPKSADGHFGISGQLANQARPEEDVVGWNWLE